MRAGEDFLTILDQLGGTKQRLLKFGLEKKVFVKK